MDDANNQDGGKKRLEELAKFTPEELSKTPEHGGRYQIVPGIGVITDNLLLQRPWVVPFLTALKEKGSLGPACEASATQIKTVRRWLEKSPQFAELVNEAMNIANDAVEAGLQERAVKGVKEPVFQGGVLVGHKQVYDTNAGIALLKFRRYKDQRMIVEGGDKPISHQHVHVHLQGQGLDDVARRIIGERGVAQNENVMDAEILEHDDSSKTEIGVENEPKTANPQYSKSDEISTE